MTEWKLSNGARVILKPTDFKNDEILFSAYSAGGTSLVPDKDYLSATFATAIIQQSGVGNFDNIALQKKLSGKIVNVDPTLGNLSEGFSGNASPQDIETFFQLVYLYGTSPRKDSTAFLSLIARSKQCCKIVVSALKQRFCRYKSGNNVLITTIVRAPQRLP